MLPLIVGCGSGGTGTISGKVFYEGRPLSTGTVTFYPEKGGGFMAGIGSDGSYKAVDVPVGSARIAVQLPARLTQRRRSEQNGAKQAAGHEKGIKEMQEHSATLLAAEYMDPDKSELVVMVKRGWQTHDILIPSQR
jgi:hypothetical protein